MGAVLPVASRKRVTLCCTGSPTSTFGGGGTKLFCSQALNATNATMAKDRRQAFAALCRAASSGVLHAGERVGFIARTPIRFVLEKVLLIGRRRFRLPRENSKQSACSETRKRK